VNQSRLCGVEPSLARAYYRLLGPEAAIDRPEDAVSIDAAMTMQVTFAQRFPCPAPILRCDGGNLRPR
jgi:hypothetical protein